MLQVSAHAGRLMLQVGRILWQILLSINCCCWWSCNRLYVQSASRFLEERRNSFFEFEFEFEFSVELEAGAYTHGGKEWGEIFASLKTLTALLIGPLWGTSPA